MEKVSIIIPAKNEEKRIGRTLKAYGDFFNQLKKKKTLDYELFVIINATTDGTEEIVKKHQKKNKNLKYVCLSKSGKGYGVIEGFKRALKDKSNKYVGFVDSDMATPPEDYYRVIRGAMKYGGSIADRYMKGSQIFPKPSFRRLIAKRVFNLWVRFFLMLPFRDTQCGAKVFERKVLEKVLPELSMSQWAFDVELIYKVHKKGYMIKPVKTKWADQEYSTINFWKAGPWMALGVLRLRILNSPFKVFIRIYDRLLRAIK